MPHSSRKKRGPQRPKRIELTDDDGWTHVTSTGSSRKAALVTNNVIESGSLKRLVQEASPELTTEKLQAQYNRCKSRFEDSSCWKKLKEDVQEHALHKEMVIDTCVCIGLGSPSAPSYHLDRRDVAMYQLAAFNAMVETIQSHQPEQPVQCFAQDPIFNSMDVQLLESLSITVLEDPEAFLHLSSNSMAFAPGHEQHILKLILNHDPAILFGHDLEAYMEIDGRWRKNTTNANSPIKVDSAEEPNNTNKTTTTTTIDPTGTLQTADLVTDYLKTKGSIKMADFEEHDHAFHGNWIRYRLANDD